MFKNDFKREILNAFMNLFGNNGLFLSCREYLVEKIITLIDFVVI